jgi:hypothetical protein
VHLERSVLGFDCALNRKGVIQHIVALDIATHKFNEEMKVQTNIRNFFPKEYGGKMTTVQSYS